ncbi:MAG TPA: glycosyltransferase family 9 protein [Candidatus Cybelea sp.]|nr:glycosyltransferase family 9 protein [Candidatus Cybelea sp.]
MAATRILVIKHGALGDFIQALGPFRAIRAHHLGSEIVLLTTPPFAELARATGCFDDIWLDERLPVWRLDALLALRAKLRSAGFARVYDLQTSARSSFYLRLFDPAHRPEWSGIARGASHRHDNPDRTRMHSVERQAEQLGLAGIAHVPSPDVTFLTGDIRRFGLAATYALLVPGGSAHRTGKRWPAGQFIELADRLAGRQIEPVLLGAADEADLLTRIAEACPAAQNLAGETSLGDVAALARHAFAAVGNDTGPMHVIAAAGCRSVVLFSDASDPKLCAPVGRDVRILRRVPLASLSVDEVAAMLEPNSRN